MIIHTILYVSDQKRSTEYYLKLLQIEPHLNVPGMSEFQLSEQHILGLMPEGGIKNLLGDTIVDPIKTNGHSRAELYFKVSDPDAYYTRAIELGGKVLSPMLPRNWGDRAGYIMDLDGNVLAFAEKL